MDMSESQIVPKRIVITIEKQKLKNCRNLQEKKYFVYVIFYVIKVDLV